MTTPNHHARAPARVRALKLMKIQRNDQGHLTDRYDRPAWQCQLHGHAAQAFAEAIRLVYESILAGEVVMGRHGGPRLLRRLLTSAESLEQMAARDREWAVALEELEQELVAGRVSR